MTGARVFVAAAFAILGVSFIASTAILVREFPDDWETMVAAHSHLFFFFPVFGLLVLAALYLPSVVFTDLYWRHLRFGRYRFCAGLVVAAVLAGGVSYWLDVKPRALWEVSPRALAVDRGEPVSCGSGSSCRRAPLLTALHQLRQAAQQRVGLSQFARNCNPDPMLEVPDDFPLERFCFPANARLAAAACCSVQARFAETVARLQADPTTRSLSGTLDVFFLPLKTFFVIIVVAIAGLLAAWRDKLEVHYKALMPAVERGVIIAAVAMLFWPAMDYGYQQTANALFGRWSTAPQLRLSLVIAPWALLLLFYFLRRLGRNLELVGQISGVLGGAIALLRYEQINDWAVRLLGTGSQPIIGAGLIGLALVGLVGLLWPLKRQETLAAA
jgi:hypothetical protein